VLAQKGSPDIDILPCRGQSTHVQQIYPVAPAAP